MAKEWKSASVTCPTCSLFLSLSNIFPCCFPLSHFCQSFSCHKIFYFSSFFLLITWLKKVAWHLPILFVSDHFVSSFHNTISFDFFAAFSVGTTFLLSSFFYSYIEIVQALHPYIKMGSIQHSRALLVWMEMYLFIITHFILWKLIFVCAILDAI